MTKTLTHEAAAQADLWRKYRLGPIQHIWRIIVGLVAAHAGTLVIVALYYMAFELNPSATHWWHTTVSNGDLRHTIRDVAEGVLGAFLAKAVIWNHFTKSHVKSGRVYDWLKRTLRLPETPTAIFAALLTFAGLFALGYWVLEKLKVHSVAAAIHGGAWAHTQAIWTNGYVNKILAFVCTFIAVRPLHNVYDDMQGYFGLLRRQAGCPLHHRWQEAPAVRLPGQHQEPVQLPRRLPRPVAYLRAMGHRRVAGAHHHRARYGRLWLVHLGLHRMSESRVPPSHIPALWGSV
jgi:hypothetical protein